MKVTVFICGVLAICTKAFLPSEESSNGRADYTHASITQKAIYHTVSDVINNVPSPRKYNASDHGGTLSTYFDRDTLLNVAKAAMDIVNENNMAQRTYMDDASRTMNCEQIVEGHLHLQSLRDSIIYQAQNTNPSWRAVRALIGQYLFTMQEFYSNTNWVEMFGDKVCQELGATGKSLPLKVSSPDMVTCVNRNYSNEANSGFSGIDNMRSESQVLTSGYTSYQEVNKPLGKFPPGMGKCSHGDPHDGSKDIPATGGISKETSSPELSPHFELHHQAGEAAIQASVDFFIGKKTGLLSVLGSNKFKELMGMNHRKPCYNCFAQGMSFVFVIDGTGSMNDDIIETAQHSIDIIGQAGYDGPSNHILLTLNDPDCTIRQTASGTEMKMWLQAMRTHNGSDCPEMTLTGLINAAKIARPGSCLFVFTYAETNSTDKKHRVIILINKKSLRTVYFLQGDHSGHRHRYNLNIPGNVQCIPNDGFGVNTGRKRRGLGGFDLFDKIAAATGGQIVHTSSSSLGSTLGSFVTNNMGVTAINVVSFEMSSALAHPISVDSDLSLVTVRIEGLSSASLFSLDQPDGTVHSFSGTSSIDVIGRTTVLSIQNPPRGTWILHKSSAGVWKVKVSGSGNIDFTYKLMENIHGLKYPISGTSPITGKKVIISVTVNGLPVTARVTDIILKKPKGAVLTVLPVTDTSRDANRVLFAEYDVKSEEFYVSINGSLNSGTFTREVSDIITPVTGSIQFASKPEKLVMGKPTAVTVSVTNAGSKGQTFQVASTSVPMGFVTGTSQTMFVEAHHSREIEIRVTAPSLELAFLTVTLNLGGSTLQTIKRTLQVAKVEPPQITVSNRTEDCGRHMMNYFNCSHQQWSLSMNIAFTVNMSKLFVTPSDIEFDYANSSSVSQSFLGTIRGTCCSYRSRITAVDVNGNMKTMDVDFSGGNVFNTTVQNFDALVKHSLSVGKKKLSVDMDRGILVKLIGGVVGSLGVIAVSVSVLLYVYKRNKQIKETTRVDPLSDICFSAPVKHVENNSRLKFVMK